jgi:predicted ATPase/class 3 adenylate cyclase
MSAPARIVTFLFTDIEGSTRLWEQEPARMRPALARHDAIARATVEKHQGVVVKMSGDGIHAVFDDPLDALNATLELQQSLADPEATQGVALRVRCGLHAGVHERRDNDFFGPAVNRAARIMSAAHGGQILISETVAVLLRDRLPEDVALCDLGSARLRDLTSPERLYQVAHPKLRQEFPPLRSLEATPNNLPQQVTSFIGRERELADVRRLLAKSRLFTLVGVGGIGKTRLSLQAAADAIDDFADGVWFVDLAPLADPQRVPQTVASVLGAKEEAGRPVVEALLKHVKDRSMLIVLDNCEHLLEACADLAKQLLQASLQLKILASSREHLRTAGEQVYTVPPLSLPEDRQIITPESLTQFEAAQLFVERALAVQPGFEVKDRDAATIADICVRLDGIPLAIELAAARVRSLSLDTIEARLSDRFRLLGGGDRTVLRRQQTLRALIDWSYELLSEPERVVLRRLSVFAGGWTLEASEAVVADGDVHDSDVVETLTRLVEKSLVVMEVDHERYRLLDTIREYASQQLATTGETLATRTRHRDYYLEYVERIFPELFSEQQSAWFARLDRELDNILAAHNRCSSEPESGQLDLRLVHAIKPYYYNRGLLALALRITTEALEHRGAAERNSLRCRGLFDAGQLCAFMGRYAVAQTYLEESLAIAREIGDRRRIAVALQLLGMTALSRDDFTEAHSYLSEALSIAREIDDQREVALALNALAQFHRVTGDLDAAEPLYRQVQQITRKLGDNETMAFAVLNLAMVAISREDAAEANVLLTDTLRIFDQIRSRPIGQSIIEVSAGLSALQRSWLQAARYFGIAEAHALHTGIHRDPADEAFLSPRIHAARGALGNEAFIAAEAAGRALSYENGIEEIRVWLGGGGSR